MADPRSGDLARRFPSFTKFMLGFVGAAAFGTLFGLLQTALGATVDPKALALIGTLGGMIGIGFENYSGGTPADEPDYLFDRTQQKWVASAWLVAAAVLALLCIWSSAFNVDIVTLVLVFAFQLCLGFGAFKLFLIDERARRSQEAFDSLTPESQAMLREHVANYRQRERDKITHIWAWYGSKDAKARFLTVESTGLKYLVRDGYVYIPAGRAELNAERAREIVEQAEPILGSGSRLFLLIDNDVPRTHEGLAMVNDAGISVLWGEP
jgi:hypothetical protein